MANIDLSPLSVKDLRDLIKRAENEISRKDQLRVSEAREAVAKIADEYGLQLEELLKGPVRGRGSRGKAAPKYRNPKDHSQTWAGRGRKPGWLEIELKSGAKLESFAIN